MRASPALSPNQAAAYLAEGQGLPCVVFMLGKLLSVPDTLRVSRLYELDPGYAQ